VNTIEELFSNKTYIAKIGKALPIFFHMANLESVRGRAIGMEVGTLREKILIAMLLAAFGRDSIDKDVSTTEYDTDFYLNKKKVSIKTSTGFYKFKLKWTANKLASKPFVDTYTPSSDLIYAFIKWNHQGGLYFVPARAQLDVFKILGRGKYLRIPSDGTNNRGIEISVEACMQLVSHPATLVIPIQWDIPKTSYDPISRWVTLWNDH
jgi:hypothetical protein